MCLCLNFLYKNQNLTAEQIAMKFGKEVVLKGRKKIFQGGGFTTIPKKPWVWGLKSVCLCLWNLSNTFWQKLYTANIAEHHQFSEVGTPFTLHICILKDLAHHVLLEPWYLILKGSR